VHIQWLSGSGHRQATRHPYLSDVDSPAAGSRRCDWAARRSALLRGGSELCRLRLSFVWNFPRAFIHFNVVYYVGKPSATKSTN